jgi:hypothetical protein
MFCLIVAGCAERPVIGVTVTNAPSTMPDCMGKKDGGGCR